MYLPEDLIDASTAWGLVVRLATYLAEVLQILKPPAFGVLRWVVDAPGSGVLYETTPQPSEWVRRVISATVELVHAHLFLAHILAWSMFFGPIIVLIPFLLMHEVFILVACNFTYVLHGLLPGSLPDQYETLRLSLLDTRESLFSFIDRSSSTFNKWTAEHLPLMVLRLAGGAFGTMLLYAIWAGW